MEWQGITGDIAWIFEHTLGYPCRIITLVYSNGSDVTLLQSGGIYFTFMLFGDSHDFESISYASYGSTGGLLNMDDGALIHNEGAITAIKMYEINQLIFGRLDVIDGLNRLDGEEHLTPCC